MSYKLQCPGSGPTPSPIFLCGEKPGLEEIRSRKPFIGRSGDEQNDYLRRYHLSTRTFYLTNLVKHYIGDRSPTDDEISYWSPTLQSEIEACDPKLIIAVGAVATRYFLGQSAALETVHGIPHHPGAFDSEVIYRAPFGSIILPIYHPALGFKDSDARSLIAWDYAQVADAVKKIKAGIAIEPRYDRYAGRETYLDISGAELESRLEDDFDEEANEFSIDTEGVLGNEFSLQVSYREGEGYMVRRDRPDFPLALRALKNRSLTPPRYREPSLVIGHNLMHDIAILRSMGLCLRRAPRLFDTMYAAYITRIESYSDDPKGRSRGKQGLKPLAWRHNGTKMLSWEDVTSEIALRDRIAYLERVSRGTWPVPRLRAEQEHDGSWSITKRQPIQKLAASILRDHRSGKLNSKGEPVDIEERWCKKIIDYVRAPAERDLGPLPNGSIRRLFAEDPIKAIRYACADSDQTLRLKRVLYRELQSRSEAGPRNLLTLMSKGMRALPMFEEMQSNGFPASRSYFESLSAQMWDEMMDTVKEISKLYFDGRPFNPCSPPQTRELMALRGLKSEKLTPGGEDSTAQKSIEHHAANDPAIAKLFEFRKREHIRDKFCTIILRSLDRDRKESESQSDISRVYSQLQTTRTATRRLAAKNPNLLNIPIRTKLGLKVREGFSALPGMVLLGGDLSQIEYRILAHFSNDRTLVKLFNDRVDIHKWTAATVNGIHIDDVTKPLRSIAKTTNYLKIYLGTGHGMADQLRKDGIEGWSVDRCDELIRETDKMFPGVPRWVREVIAETYETEMSCSYEGMPRYLPGIRSRHEATRKEAERHAVSQRIQGTAQDMLQNSMIWLTPRIWSLQDAGEKAEPILQVHDELIFMADPEIVPTMTTLLRWALVREGGVPMRVPIECDIHSGYRWSDLKD